MSAAKQELKKVVNELSDDESRIVLKVAEWLREQNPVLIYSLVTKRHFLISLSISGVGRTHISRRPPLLPPHLKR
jgi:hypothetical protein